MDLLINYGILFSKNIIIGCHPYLSTLRINGKREPIREDEQHVVVNLRWLCLEDTKKIGRVDKDDNYKDDNLGNRDIHLQMDGKPPT
jgi:hypothetical protein